MPDASTSSSSSSFFSSSNMPSLTFRPFFSLSRSAMTSNKNNIVMDSPALAVVDDLVKRMDKVEGGIHRLDKTKDKLHGLQLLVASLVEDNMALGRQHIEAAKPDGVAPQVRRGRHSVSR